MFKVGDRVRILESAFPGSDDPDDAKVRGKVGIIIWDCGDGLWDVEVDDADLPVPVLESEIEAV
jgi:hypothetical protein